MRRRSVIDRRRFLAASAGTLGAAVFGHWPLDRLLAESAPSQATDWDTGWVRHLLPSVSDSRILLKASFERRLGAAPVLRVEAADGAGIELRVDGRPSDTAGEFWQFHVTDLLPARRYRLSLAENRGRALCDPWEISTFPERDASPERFRLLFFTCAGGPSGTYEGIGQRSGFLPTAIRNRLLRRALREAPDAAVANGDHIYWDLHTWLGENPGQLSPAARESNFDFSASIFFLQDDHDHWENDGADVFPIPWFQLQLARATQSLYYPEFLPDARRPVGLPWSHTPDRGDLSESFGTLRYGDLAEVLLYDVRRTVTVSGANPVFIDRQVEGWLIDRTQGANVRHLVHAPSNPFGWSAGKWGEWYPDILDRETGELTTAIEKPWWQPGWLEQHDRLISAIAARRDRVPLVVSGDLHAIGMGRIHRAGTVDLNAHPVNAVLSGPIGTSVRGFPSNVRGVGSTPPAHLDNEETVAPIEDHGFTVADFLRDRIVLRQYRWDVDLQPVEAIDTLEPFFTTALPVPG